MKLLFFIAIIWLITFVSNCVPRVVGQTQTVSDELEYVNGGPEFKESHKTFTYTYTVDKKRDIILLFDSTNISKGDNYRFVEFLQMIPLLPVKYTFDVKVNSSKRLKNREMYKDFYIYNFKIVFEAKKI